MRAVIHRNEKKGSCFRACGICHQDGPSPHLQAKFPRSLFEYVYDRIPEMSDEDIAILMAKGHVIVSTKVYGGNDVLSDPYMS